MTAVTRLVGLASALADVVLEVPALPVRGGDVLATASRTRAGGGVNALLVAVSAGLPVVYAGAHGTGPFGDLVRATLADHGIGTVLAPTAGEDTGFCVVLVEPDGERTFATTIGAEGHLSAGVLAGVAVAPGDAVYLSGYDLVYPHAGVLAGWVAELPEGVMVLLDPGPLVGDIPRPLLDKVFSRTTWLSCNTAEALVLTGEEVPVAAAAALLGAIGTGHGGQGVVVRAGPRGASLATRGTDAVTVPAVPAEGGVDTNGAGDAHVGAFLAALAAGASPHGAVARANAAAAAWMAAPR